MRKMAALALWMCLTNSALLSAQDRNYSNLPDLRGNVEPPAIQRMVSPEQLIFERAALRAQQRTARMNSRNSINRSTLRPMATSRYGIGNPYPWYVGWSNAASRAD